MRLPFHTLGSHPQIPQSKTESLMRRVPDLYCDERAVPTMDGQESDQLKWCLPSPRIATALLAIPSYIVSYVQECFKHYKKGNNDLKVDKLTMRLLPLTSLLTKSARRSSSSSSPRPGATEQNWNAPPASISTSFPIHHPVLA